MIRKILMTIVMVALLAGVAQSADNYYTGTVTVENDAFGQTVIKYVTPLMADSIGSYHSPPIYIGGLNATDGFISGVTKAVAGTEDVNVIVHVGDKLAWTSITTGLDQLTGSTAQNDTLGITSGTNDLAFHANPWIVIECDGQASNPIATQTTVKLVLPKAAYLITANGQPVKIAGYQRTPVTGDTNP